MYHISASGVTPSTFVKNSDNNSRNTDSAQPKGEVVGLKFKCMSTKEDTDRMLAAATQAYREGKVIDLRKHATLITDTYVPDPEREGKTIVENYGSGIVIGKLYTEDGKWIETASDHNKQAKAGEATHGFFY